MKQKFDDKSVSPGDLIKIEYTIDGHYCVHVGMFVSYKRPNIDTWGEIRLWTKRGLWLLFDSGKNDDEFLQTKLDYEDVHGYPKGSGDRLLTGSM